MAGLADRLIKAVKSNNGAYFMNEENCIANQKDDNFIQTRIPMLNLALGGSVDKGLGAGVTVFAGPSKHFKTSYGLECMSAFQKKYKDGMCVYLDSEFGSMDVLDNFDIDRNRVLHIPIVDIEELKFNVVSILNDISRDDRLFLFVDSVGNLASRKEIEDMEAGKSTTDMTRAKALKSFFRVITPKIMLNNVYTYFIAHTYDTQEIFSKKIVSGGQGITYSANTAIIVGKSQVKNGTELNGFQFTLNIDKSRTIKEKAKIPIVVTFEDGILPYSGLSEVAVELGIVQKVKRRSNMLVFKDVEIKEKESGTAKEFWVKVFKESNLKEEIEKKYKL